jgi:hypothetical protein
MPRSRPFLALLAAIGPSAIPALAHEPGCPADMDGNGVTDLFDFLSFVNEFNAQDPAADFDGNGEFDLFDFLAFTNEFIATNGVCDPAANLPVPLVFVSRQIPDRGSIYWNAPFDLPGVGPYSRVRPAAPGGLMVLETDGSTRTLIDGASPGPGSLFLIDVNAPTVSWDGLTIAFAGLPQGNWEQDPARSVGGWRLYTIDADGSNLRQVTYSDQNLDYTQFGDAAPGLHGYDDYDPAFLPDGRIVFSSTRWPSFAQYSGVRTSNLYVVDTDGSRLHRITAERNGADRPSIDNKTGKVVYARWWRNHRFPLDDMSTVYVNGDPAQGILQSEGLTTDRDHHVDAPSQWRNFWQMASIRSDGQELTMLSGRFRSEPANHFYGGAFAPDGSVFGNFFPMFNMTEAAGFGGIRRYQRGASDWSPIAGIADLSLDYVHPNDPTSYGIFNGHYAAEPEVLPDGRVVFSLARNIYQDYGLYVMDQDGANIQPLFDRPGTTELRARVLAKRKAPPVTADTYRDDPLKPFPALLPPPAGGPYDADGTFVFKALNVYFNGAVDMDIVSAPAVGSASTIRFFIDQQRTSPGSFPALDWPILLGENSISPDGSVTETQAPANVPLFEQLRGPRPSYAVPLTGGPYPQGAGHVTGMNFAPDGAVAQCVGCHTGHTLLTIPQDPLAAAWTNLAPGAILNVSSSRDPQYTGGLIDRRQFKGEIWRSWTTQPGQQQGQWATLTFGVPVAVRGVRLYNPRFGDEADSSIQVHQATVRLYADEQGNSEVGVQTTGPLSASGTDVYFADVNARMVRVELDDVSGTFYGAAAAGLGEVEVIAKGSQ